MTTLAIVGALVLGFFVWLVVRAKAPNKSSVEAADPDFDMEVALDELLLEAKTTNELLRQLLRAYGHDPEA